MCYDGREHNIDVEFQGRISHREAVKRFRSHINKQIKSQLKFLETSQHADRRQHSKLNTTDVMTVKSVKFAFDWDGKGNAIPYYDEKEREWNSVDQVRLEGQHDSQFDALPINNSSSPYCALPASF